MMKKISQREARRLRKRVTKLEREAARNFRRYGGDWPGVTLVHKIRLNDRCIGTIDGAIRCGRFLVARVESDETLTIYGVEK